MAEIAGIDFSWSHPDPAAVVQAGYRFVMGYLSHDPSKNMTAGLAQGYLGGGLSVGLVWESTATRVLSGAAGGAQDGAAAEQQADAIGYPRNCVIYLAVDYAQPAGDFPVTQAYCAAFDSATSRPVGIYGGFAVVEHFVTPGRRPVQSGWQTVAWSNGRISAKADIYQRNTRNYPPISGIASDGYDEDVLMHADVGLWKPDSPLPPPHVQPPTSG